MTIHINNQIQIVHWLMEHCSENEDMIMHIVAVQNILSLFSTSSKTMNELLVNQIKHWNKNAKCCYGTGVDQQCLGVEKANIYTYTK